MNEDKIKKIDEALKQLAGHSENCRLCPRECTVNRAAGQKGICGTGADLVIYTAFLHKGEEPPLSGGQGSGAVFFSGCGLRCFYCQNHHFSHEIRGDEFSCQRLAELMLSLQKKKAHNINLVTPTHYLGPILKGLRLALEQGLNLPLVYNSSGYEKDDILRLLEGIMDIYLPDFKYNAPGTAAIGSEAADYPKFIKPALREMYRQQKTAVWENGLLKKGMIVRHLVLPEGVEESKEILTWLHQEVPEALVSVMFQYRPYHIAEDQKRFNRPVSREEYDQITSFLADLDLNGWVQEFNPPEDMAGVHFKPFPS